MLGVLIEGAVRMAELMNLIRMGARALYSDGELSDRDYHLLMDTAESILRELEH